MLCAIVAACEKWTLTVPAKYGSEGEGKEGDLVVEVWLAWKVCVEEGLDGGGILLGTDVQMVAFLYLGGQSSARWPI